MFVKAVDDSLKLFLLHDKVLEVEEILKRLLLSLELSATTATSVVLDLFLLLLTELHRSVQLQEVIDGLLLRRGQFILSAPLPDHWLRYCDLSEFSCSSSSPLCSSSSAPGPWFHTAPHCSSRTRCCTASTNQITVFRRWVDQSEASIVTPCGPIRGWYCHQSIICNK